MSFVVFMLAAVVVSSIGKATGAEIRFTDADCIVLAILSGAEVISWRCRK